MEQPSCNLTLIVVARRTRNDVIGVEVAIVMDLVEKNGIEMTGDVAKETLVIMARHRQIDKKMIDDETTERDTMATGQVRGVTGIETEIATVTVGATSSRSFCLSQ